jgi:ubiquinone biosynthesis protein UbiJ
MTTERWTDETLDKFASTVATAITASNERMTRIEQDGERSKRESDERLTRIEQLVESNNRFLEAFTERVDRLAQKVDRLTDNTDRVIQQMAASTSNANQERMDVTTRLSAITRKVDAIASHLGLGQ